LSGNGHGGCGEEPVAAGVDAMGVRDLAEVLLEAMGLKWMPRAGWQMRGVPNPESVAEHTFGVAFTALLLAGALQEAGGQAPELKLDRVLTMAVLHDLAEVRLTDLPASAVRLISGPVKSQAEAEAISHVLARLPQAKALLALWHDFEEDGSAEGRLVRDADKLEMVAQCLRYEQAGCRGLDEFWLAMDQHAWYVPLSAGVYARLKALRHAASRTSGTDEC
jgi:putative hydrolase of HD superfamily